MGGIIALWPHEECSKPTLPLFLYKVYKLRLAFHFFSQQGFSAVMHGSFQDESFKGESLEGLFKKS